MKKYFRVGVVLLLVLGSVALVFAGIKETQRVARRARSAKCA